MTAPAYNPPAPGYKHPQYRYVVVMRRAIDGQEYASDPLDGGAVDSWLGRQHRGHGDTYVRTEQVPA